MAVVEFSAGLMSGLPSRMTSPTTSGTKIGPIGNSAGSYVYHLLPIFPYSFYLDSAVYPYYSYLTINKGTVPTDFSGLTATTSRSADVLATYQIHSSNAFISNSQFTPNPVVINSLLSTASASGTASWFRIYSYFYNVTTPMHQVVGTIGASGSGADLEMGDINIVTGRNYRIQNLRIQFPSSWTY